MRLRWQGKESFREAVINAFAHNSWVDDVSPMFTAYQDRIEITSIGQIPPKQTKEGFYRGVSIPVNKKLSEIMLQLHISERSGRGVPRIVEEYGESAFEFTDNSIIVTIPFNRLDIGGSGGNVKLDVPAKGSDAPVKGSDAPVNGSDVPVNGFDAPVNATDVPVKVNANGISEAEKRGLIEDEIIRFCSDPKGIMEIAEHLGYKDKRTVRGYLATLLELGRVARTVPDKPNSRNQKYVTIS